MSGGTRKSASACARRSPRSARSTAQARMRSTTSRSPTSAPRSVVPRNVYVTSRIQDSPSAGEDDLAHVLPLLDEPVRRRGVDQRERLPDDRLDAPGLAVGEEPEHLPAEQVDPVPEVPAVHAYHGLVVVHELH